MAVTTQRRKKSVEKKQFTYSWSGIDRYNEKVKGEIVADSPQNAKLLLVEQQIKVKKVAKKIELGNFKKNASINSQDLTFFTRQMATMMQSGVPLVQSFDISSQGMEKIKMKGLVDELREDVAGGNLLSVALKKHPKFFDSLFCQLVMVGEQSGTLDHMLDRLASYKEKTEALKAKIKKALTYPIAVIVVAIIVTAILLIKVVPQFESLFKGFGADLPVFTQFVVNLSRALQEWWWVVLGILMVSGFLLKRAHQNSEQFRHKLQLLSLRVPIIGGILHQAALARFSRTLCTTYASGVPLVDALNSAAGATGNIFYERAILQAKRSVSGGLNLRNSLVTTGVFPNMVIQMIGIGEDAGSLETMLDKLAIFYETAVDNAVDSLTALLEPMIMCVLGVLVGGLIIAMYLPIFQLGSVVG
ncbi:type II secretion system protein F [Pokkaliibacter plantistimulans]|uniref:Type II secretion system protein F n=1 Tax=Proteobacteria bacterium 228 TaxID=2083153 RepID=A0A2S5KLZ9_9PROT|nr:type II secretion system F family protein [Pokkaliibacter plantistimulans]PPC75675.1 type II secretion system protein F [Pokkaliibacter plantistimulans]